MPTTASAIIQTVNDNIHNAKGKLGGDPGMLRLLNEAVTNLRTSMSLAGAKRYGNPFIFTDACHEYPVADDLSYDKIIDFVDEQSKVWEFQKSVPKEFYQPRNPMDDNIMGNSYSIDNISFNSLGPRRGVYAVDFVDGMPYLLVRSAHTKQRAMLNSCDTYDQNGTWVGSGDITNVGTDNQSYRQGSGSVIFDLLGLGTSAVITNSTMDVVNLSSFTSKGRGFFDLFIPTTAPSSIEVRWGSSATDYWSRTMTTQQNGLAPKIGWNIFGFDWRNATVTGTPVDTAVNYVSIIMTFGSAAVQTGFRLDDVRFGLGVGVQQKYYSTKLIRDGVAPHTALSAFVDTEDYTILRESEVQLLVEEATQVALKRLREFNEAKDRLATNYLPMKAQYMLDNPDEQEVKSYTYYNM
jgi:hypothetical protein